MKHMPRRQQQHALPNYESPNAQQQVVSRFLEHKQPLPPEQPSVSPDMEMPALEDNETEILIGTLTKGIESAFQEFLGSKPNFVMQRIINKINDMVTQELEPYKQEILNSRKTQGQHSEAQGGQHFSTEPLDTKETGSMILNLLRNRKGQQR